MAGHSAGEAIIATQRGAHLRRQRVIERTVQVTHLNQRRINLPARAAGGDDLDLAPLAPGNQCGLGVHTVDAVDHAIDIGRDVLGHRLAGHEIRHRVHGAIRVDAFQALGHDLDLGLAHRAVQRMQLTVAVADAYIIEVKQRNLAHAAASDGFRRPRTHPAHADDGHMGRLQALQAFNAIQAGDAGKPWIFCTHDHYPKNRRAL
eukprot:gene11238-biopygen4196